MDGLIILSVIPATCLTRLLQSGHGHRGGVAYTSRYSRRDPCPIGGDIKRVNTDYVHVISVCQAAATRR